MRGGVKREILEFRVLAVWRGEDHQVRRGEGFLKKHEDWLCPTYHALGSVRLWS